MAEARRLADEAVTAAEEAADEAHRQARELAEQTRGLNQDAEEQVAEARQTGDAASKKGALSSNDDAKDLDKQTQQELLGLAKSMGIENHADMKKDELVAAIRTASKAS